MVQYTPAQHGKLNENLKRAHNDVDIFRRRASPPPLVLVAFAVCDIDFDKIQLEISLYGELSVRMILPSRIYLSELFHFVV